ncbi:glycosyltransferase family 4 protein [Bradyrhizobium sp. BRP22]|uniref:glycosyltransferase family 4 protein n=1 Tax=Bradyrhizobium sp. BRP22 TaxID=2793821 RepID=UPI001CD542FF|nr:glycosyltransferase family 4 protein [Bradyrhizobium sp. BRP22]
MRILLVTQYFWPESFIVNELVQRLVARGHSVTVVTGKPNYPTGQIHPPYTRHGIQCERYEGASVIRVPCRPRHKASALDLSLNYMSFVFSGLLRFPWLLRGRDVDVILVFTTPITAAIPAILLRRLKRCHLALWVQDLWPDVVKSTGFAGSRLVSRGLRLVSDFVYGAGDTVFVQSEKFVRPISETISSDRIFVLPNFAASYVSEEIVPLPIHIQRLFCGRFSVVFAGNLGRAQALTTIVEAARVLQSRPEILIIVAGTGSDAESLRRAAADAGINNLAMVGMLDNRMMPELFRLADCLLVTLGRDAALNATIPSKVQAYLKAGRPIVGAISGAAADLIEKSGAGLTVEAEDAAGLARSILELTDMPFKKRLQMGEAGQAYYKEHFEAEHVIGRLLRVLESRMGGHA